MAKDCFLREANIYKKILVVSFWSCSDVFFLTATVVNTPTPFPSSINNLKLKYIYTGGKQSECTRQRDLAGGPSPEQELGPGAAHALHVSQEGENCESMQCNKIHAQAQLAIMEQLLWRGDSAWPPRHRPATPPPFGLARGEKVNAGAARSRQRSRGFPRVPERIERRGIGQGRANSALPSFPGSR